ncbi:M24 family metallopeptidase [Actinocrispum wychmicini]|uniref:Xaa-Pro aminopeptidase n=1 Tax=Actinocrispum wychmicini TaxID=1213861 RepID=A0A4R2JBU6_9PSEU|nr:Xaa-Pro peptidase family protein [Actinocrispum wychmicini]TCO53559.1 Xaa-Pro aminopeptidase [Actinocrispum wychmicini]
MSSAAWLPAPEILRSRLDRAAEAAGAAGLDALLITPGSDLRYLTGAVGGSFERLTCLVLAADGTATLVVPKLEFPGYRDVLVDDLGVQAATWVDGENPAKLVAGLLSNPKRVGVSDFTPALHVFGLRDALVDVEQHLAGPVIGQLRMRKDASEIEALREAGAAIDRVHARMAEFLRAGRTENEVAADIAAAIVEEGHTRAEFVIVGSGSNGASPHHSASDRVIEQGDVVVIDIGGPVAAGYNSDSTRVYAVGTPRDADVANTYAVLQEAQAAAVNAVRPGITAEEVDQAARQVIAAAGFGDYFIHRTGHGIGLDVHEDPYIVDGNAIPLEAGMAFSVEPGIYQPGRWGARIEDIVVVTADGVESMNNQPHELVVLGE